MAGETTLTLIGNLTSDLELRYTPSGTAVANFTVASTPRVRDEDGGWRDGEPLYLRCTLWRDAAEYANESLSKGARVIVVGRLTQRTYETPSGEKRTVYELQVDELGASLRYATAKVTKAPRRANGRTTTEDPWGSSARTAAAGTDEPPF